jgi:hypothetical protein
MWYVVAVPEFDTGGERYSEEQKSAFVDQAIAAEGIDLNDDRVVIIRTFARGDCPGGRIVNRFRTPTR